SDGLRSTDVRRRLTSLSLSETKEIESAEAVQGSSWIGWLPLPVLPLSAVAFRNVLPPWAFMWVLALAIYFSLKWLTWWRARTRIAHATWRSAAYLWLGREWMQRFSWMRVGAYRRHCPQLGCGRSSKQFSVQFCSGLWRGLFCRENHF